MKMSHGSEMLRAGIALLEVAARTLEQTLTEFGGNTSELNRARISAMVDGCRGIAASAVKEYDKARKP